MAHSRTSYLVPLATAAVNFSFQFHDSEVRQVQAAGAASDDLCVTFSAAAVRSPDRQNGGDGYVLNLEMRLTRATGSGTLADGVGRLSAGALCIDGVPLSPVPLPLARDGRVEVTLNFTNGTVLSIAAIAIEFRFAGDVRFVESFAC